MGAVMSNEVRRFLQIVTEHASRAAKRQSDRLQLSAVNPDSGKLYYKRFEPDAVDAMAAYAQAADKAKRNAYIEGRLVSADTEGRGKFEDTTAVFAFVIDFDADKDMGWQGDAEASLVVETSPGNKQAWFFLKEAVDHREGKLLGDRIRAATGSDHDTGTVTQPYRIAGTDNYPDTRKRARGRVVCPTRILKEGGHLWTPQELFAAFPGIARKKKGTNKTDSGKDSSTSGLFYREVCRLFEKGKTVDEVVADIEAHPRMWEETKAEVYADRNGGLRKAVEDCFTKWKADHADADQDVAEINKQHALVVIGDKVAIMKESAEITLMQVNAFRQWFSNRHVQVGKRSVPLAQHWLEHPQRRQYGGIVFAPGNDAPAGHFNLWRGFAVEPRKGDCSKFLEHIRENVCCGSEKRYNWVIAWFAQIVQHPQEKPGLSLALRGPEGVGKTIVGKVFGSLLGPHYVGPVSESRYVTGRFNAHMSSCLLLHADEAFWAGDRSAEGRVKDLITGTQHPIEYKGKEVIWVENYIRLLVSGNEDWIVPASMEARRWAVLDVGTDHIKDIDYFAAIDAEMKNGGRAALLHYLLEFDLSKVNLHDLPKTQALLHQKLASLSPELGWWFDVLQRGQLPDAIKNLGANFCLGDKLFENYLEHAERQGVRRRAIETMLGMQLNKWAPGLRSRRMIVGMKRQRVYEFPTLEECRDKFSDMLHQHVTWDGPDEWEIGLAATVKAA